MPNTQLWASAGPLFSPGEKIAGALLPFAMLLIIFWICSRRKNERPGPAANRVSWGIYEDGEAYVFVHNADGSSIVILPLTGQRWLRCHRTRKLCCRECAVTVECRETHKDGAHKEIGLCDRCKYQLTHCQTCGEWQNKDQNILCICAGVRCEYCGELFHRPASSYYDEEKGEVWHVPAFAYLHGCT